MGSTQDNSALSVNYAQSSNCAYKKCSETNPIVDAIKCEGCQTAYHTSCATRLTKFGNEASVVCCGSRAGSPADLIQSQNDKMVDYTAIRDIEIF